MAMNNFLPSLPTNGYGTGNKNISSAAQANAASLTSSGKKGLNSFVNRLLNPQTGASSKAPYQYSTPGLGNYLSSVGNMPSTNLGGLTIPTPFAKPQQPNPGSTAMPSSNGATAPTPVKITPPANPSQKPSASESAYVASQLGTQQPTAPTPPSSPVAKTPEEFAMAGAPTDSTYTGRKPSTPSTPTTPTAPKSSYDSAMESYLASLKNSQDITSRVRQTQLEGNRQYQADLDASGGLLGGNQATAALTARRTNATLADLGVAQDAATNAANLELRRVELEKGKLPDNDPFTLSEGQTRFDSKGNRIAMVGKGSTSGSASDPAIESWAKLVRSDPARLAQVPEAIRTQVVQAIGNLPASSNPEVQQAVQKATIMLGDANGTGGLINEALGLVNGINAGFAGARLANIEGTDAYNLARALDTIKANLGFQELAAMRAASPTGGALGSITERELQFLQSTVASLDQGQDPAKLRENLEKVREHYQNWVDAVQQANNGTAAPSTPSSGVVTWDQL